MDEKTIENIELKKYWKDHIEELKNKNWKIYCDLKYDKRNISGLCMHILSNKELEELKHNPKVLMKKINSPEDWLSFIGEKVKYLDFEFDKYDYYSVNEEKSRYMVWYNVRVEKQKTKNNYAEVIKELYNDLKPASIASNGFIFASSAGCSASAGESSSGSETAAVIPASDFSFESLL